MNTGAILLVEGNEDDELLTLTALKQRNIVNKIIVVRDGSEALDYLSGSNRSGDPYDMPELIILDMKLPRMNGLDVLQSIRSDPRTAGLPVVFFSSSNEVQDVNQAYTRGANSYLRKPMDFEQYVEVVGQLCLYWLTVNEPYPSW